MMLKQNNKSDRGFTLVELAIVLIIIGIIGAIAAPSFLGLLNRYRVTQASEKLFGAIYEAQRQAIRQGKLCRVNIDVATNNITGNPPNCLLNDRKIEENINIRSNIRGKIPNISFSYRGSTTKMGTIVVSSDNSQLQRCFVISLGTGISRTGIYLGDKTGSVTYKKCHRVAPN